MISVMESMTLVHDYMQNPIISVKDPISHDPIQYLSYFFMSFVMDLKTLVHNYHVTLSNSCPQFCDVFMTQGVETFHYIQQLLPSQLWELETRSFMSTSLQDSTHSSC